MPHAVGSLSRRLLSISHSAGSSDGALDVRWRRLKCSLEREICPIYMSIREIFLEIKAVKFLIESCKLILLSHLLPNKNQPQAVGSLKLFPSAIALRQREPSIGELAQCR